MRALRHPTAQAGVVIAGGLVLRLIFFGGLRGEDDTAYWQLAEALRAGRYVPESLAALRWMVLLPLAVSQTLFGAREAAAMAVMLAYSLAELVITYALGRLAGGPTVGLAAAAIVALVPQAVVHATDLHPDLPLAVYWALAMYATWRGERAASHGTAWFMAAGAALGAATLTKEYGPFLLLVLLARALYLRRGERGYAWLAGTCLAVLVADAVAMAWITGTPWFRYTSPVRWTRLEQLAKVPGSYDWVLAFPNLLLNPAAGSFGYFAGLFYAVVAATVWGVRRRQSSIVEMALWWAPVLALLTFTPTDLTFTRSPILPAPRYLHPLIVPGAVAVAVWLVAGIAHRPRVRAIVAATFAALSLVGAWVAQSDARLWVLPARRMVPIIADLPPDTVVAADHTSTVLLPVLLGSDRRAIVPHAAAGLPNPSRPTLVVRDPVFLATDLRLGRSVPAPVVTPPPEWRKVAEIPRPRRKSLRQALADGLGMRAPAAPPAADQTVVLWSTDRVR